MKRILNIIILSLMLLQVSAGNSPINHRKNKDVANLYNKAIDYVIAQLDVKESEVYILNGLNSMSWHPNNVSTFQNDSIIKIITYVIVQQELREACDNGGDEVIIPYKFKRGAKKREVEKKKSTVKYFLSFSKISSGLFDVAIHRNGGKPTKDPTSWMIVESPNFWYLGGYIFECNSSLSDFVNVYSDFRYNPKDFVDDDTNEK